MTPVAATSGRASQGRIEPRPRLTRLASEDLPRLYRFHLSLHVTADGPDLFMLETRDFFSRHLGPDGRVIGLETWERDLVAYGVLGLPASRDPYNFGRLLGLSAESRARVAHVDGSGVAPAWRGQHIQRRMTRLRFRAARRCDRTIVLSTAAPLNAASLQNLLVTGMRVVALITERNRPRFVLRRDLDRPGPIEPDFATASALVALDDHAAHARRLADGWHGAGLGRDEHGRTALLYVPPGRRAS